MISQSVGEEGVQLVWPRLENYENLILWESRDALVQDLTPAEVGRPVR